MSRIGLFFVCLVFLLDTGCGISNSNSFSHQLVISCSTQLLPLVEALASDFQRKTQIRVVVKGTLGQESSLIRQELSDLVVTYESLGNSGFEEQVIGYDQTVVIGHTDNPVNKVTQTELRRIFAGETSNWSELEGGENLAIQVFSREPGSGARRSFESRFLKSGDTVSLRALNVNSNPEMKAAIASIKGGIGYLSIGALSQSVQEIQVLDDQTREPLTSAKSTIFLTWRIDDEDAASEKFRAYLRDSPDALRILSDEGYLPAEQNSPTN
ncbi:MAG: substrate-binding domain-containing protein [Candidatus Caenarcaniphilales bacterium]|nr:substrate-binding domain-containing protein [Candidatus Caenarcaniphilales bacterium]